MTDPIRHFGRGRQRLGLDVLDGCTADNCDAAADPYAPVPLCEHHVREAFVYQMLKAEHVSGGVAETVEHEPPQPGRISRTQGFVYFIRFADRIKIGWSANPGARLKELPHDEVLHLEPGTMLDERNLHAMFAEHRVIGEWFNDVPEIRIFIKGLAAKSA